MAWDSMPISSSLASIFLAVVVLPLPEGPERSTIRDLLRLSAIRRAAASIFLLYAASHSSTNPLGSLRTASLISFRE